MYMKINFGNPDHVHVLIDLPTALSIEKVVQVLKGSSSHWVNSSEVVTGRFAWGRVRGVLGVTVKRGSGGAIHRRSGRAPLRAHIRGGTARIYRSSRIALARCGKPLKRLATCSDARSPARRPVLMRGSRHAARACSVPPHAPRACSHCRANRATSREFFRSSLSLMCALWVSTVLGLRCKSFAI